MILRYNVRQSRVLYTCMNGESFTRVTLKFKGRFAIYYFCWENDAEARVADSILSAGRVTRAK